VWTVDKTSKATDAVPGRHVAVNLASMTTETFKAEVSESWQGVQFKIVLAEYLTPVGLADAKILCSVHLPVLCKEYGTEVIWLPKTANLMIALEGAKQDLLSAGLVRRYEVSDPIANPLYDATLAVIGDDHMPSGVDKEFPFICLETEETRFGLKHLEEKLKKTNEK